MKIDSPDHAGKAYYFCSDYFCSEACHQRPRRSSAPSEGAVRSSWFALSAQAGVGVEAALACCQQCFWPTGSANAVCSGRSVAVRIRERHEPIRDRPVASQRWSVWVTAVRWQQSCRRARRLAAVVTRSDGRPARVDREPDLDVVDGGHPDDAGAGADVEAARCSSCACRSALPPGSTPPHAAGLAKPGTDILNLVPSWMMLAV